ncbi:glycosyltransferase family 4 protein [Chthonobacter albigriseus]|uniref:glycosyltransferase family 4 protein n=1 Tax=Chthonobacter albigriseus TaxID=1683161 RepID=UPI0015EE9386|nr:glycosyltransferase family 4 protein [Chthonobacter albigriseus]
MRWKAGFYYPPSYHYRQPFHENVRSLLASSDVDYCVYYSEPFGSYKIKKDTVEIPWGRKVPLLRLGNKGPMLQMAFADVLASDLVIVQQENLLLLNYFCQMISLAGRQKVAFFGHGRNFQSRDPHSLAERFKSALATRVDWWFAYTDQTSKHLQSIGYPADRITVFNNAVDTSTLRSQAAAVTAERLAIRRAELGLVGSNTCVYVGGIYPDKRVPFLVECLDLIRAAVPDFEFVAVGGGVDLPLLEQAAKDRPWLKVTGPRFGQDKVELMALGKLFLIPGLVGLAVLDAGVMGLPVVTTDYPYHSPEIAYLEDGRSGLIVKPWSDAKAYADAVIGLLGSDRLPAMSEASRAIAARYTIEAMAERFAEGVLKALAAPPK